MLIQPQPMAEQDLHRHQMDGIFWALMLHSHVMMDSHYLETCLVTVKQMTLEVINLQFAIQVRKSVSEIAQMCKLLSFMEKRKFIAVFIK